MDGILRTNICLIIFILSCLNCAYFMPLSQRWSTNYSGKSRHSGSPEVSVKAKILRYNQEGYGIFSSSTEKPSISPSSSSCPDGNKRCQKQQYIVRKPLATIFVMKTLTDCPPNKVLASTGKCIDQAKFSQRTQKKSKRKYNSNVRWQMAKIANF
ncbi:hypothetical protein CHUAL_002098 [Chamberlinius hualienensis]